MLTRPTTTLDVEFQPLTPDRWSDLERLFGERGACNGCWCMFWRDPHSEGDRLGNAGRKQAFKHIVKTGQIPGILAYSNGEPIGWCSIAPRETYAALERSRNLKPIDDQPVWSITCFFIDRSARHSNLMPRLIEAAVRYAQTNGATIVEAYPTETEGHSRASADLYMGVASAFQAAGFRPVKREPRLIMRYFVGA